jgi:hypothetical protein
MSLPAFRRLNGSTSYYPANNRGRFPQPHPDARRYSSPRSVYTWAELHNRRPHFNSGSSLLDRTSHDMWEAGQKKFGARNYCRARSRRIDVARKWEPHVAQRRHAVTTLQRLFRARLADKRAHVANKKRWGESYERSAHRTQLRAKGAAALRGLRDPKIVGALAAHFNPPPGPLVVRPIRKPVVAPSIIQAQMRAAKAAGK